MSVPFALPWLAFALAWLVLGPVAVLLHRVLRPALLRLPANQRAALLLALAVLPFVAAVLVAVLGFAPEIGGLAVNGHCHAGSGCGPHVPVLHASTLTAIAAGTSIFLVSAMLCWYFAERLRRSLAFAGTLHALAQRPRADTEFATVETPVPFAYCIGLLRPRVIVSRGLLTRLSASERGAVVAHERAHAQRFDNLRQWLAVASLWFLPRALRAPLVGDLAAAAEQACDAMAADATGEASLAAALKALGVRDAEVAERVRAAGSAVQPLPGTGALAVVVLLYTSCVLPLLDGTHFAVEWLIGRIG